MRISDWSSDVCSSDLEDAEAGAPRGLVLGHSLGDQSCLVVGDLRRQGILRGGLVERRHGAGGGDRKSVVEGKSVSVRVDLGGRRIIKQKNKYRIIRAMQTSKIII